MSNAPDTRETVLTPCPACGGAGAHTGIIDLGCEKDFVAETCSGCGGTGRAAPVGGGFADGIEAAARLCDAEEKRRLANSEAARDGSQEWGEPKQAEMAQAHKAVTAGALAKEIRALSPSAHPGNEIVKALEEARDRFKRIATIIERNLFHQQEKIEDAKSIAIDGGCAIDAALTTHSDGWFRIDDEENPPPKPALGEQRIEIMVAGGTCHYPDDYSDAGYLMGDGVAFASWDAVASVWEGEQFEGHDRYKTYRPTHWKPKPKFTLPTPPREA